MILGRPARASAWWDNVLADMAIMLDIRHLQISYNTPCLPPPPPPAKFCKKIFFNFSWVLQPSKEKLKTCKVFLGGRGGGWGASKVHCGRFASAVPFLAVLIHSLLRAPALFSFRLARRSVIFKAKRK